MTAVNGARTGLSSARAALDDLANFDFSDLRRVEAIGDWPSSVRQLLLFSLFLVTFLCFTSVLLVPKFFALSREKSRIDIMQEELTSSMEKANQLPSLRSQERLLERRYAEQLMRFSGSTKKSGLLSEFTAVGLVNDVGINSIHLQPERVSGYYFEQTIEIKLRGTFHDFVEFLQDLSALNRLITFQDFSIVGNSIRLVATVYRLENGFGRVNMPLSNSLSSSQNLALIKSHIPLSGNGSEERVAPIRMPEPLEQHPLSEVEFVGFFRKLGRYSALIELEDGDLFLVEVGDYLGGNNGQVQAITSDRIELREKVIVADGVWEERTQIIALREPDA